MLPPQTLAAGWLSVALFACQVDDSGCDGDNCNTGVPRCSTGNCNIGGSRCSTENCNVLHDLCRVRFVGEADDAACFAKGVTYAAGWSKAENCVDVCNAEHQGVFLECVGSKKAELDGASEYDRYRIWQQCVTATDPSLNPDCEKDCDAARATCEKSCPATDWNACMTCSAKCGLDWVACEDRCHQ